MRITLVNHACVRIETAAGAILSDPWLEASAFNCGWDLLIQTPLALDAVMAGVRFIWLSHEHPDHFAPRFFKAAAKHYAGRVTVLYRRTADRRVKRFCEEQGFVVRELDDGLSVALAGNLSAVCGRSDLYDSWLYLSDGDRSVLNVNDCPLTTRAELRTLRAVAMEPDVMLAQFSYAAWEGGAAAGQARAAAARRKLAMLSRLIRALRPRYTVPFASLIYFSNEENAYMNDRVNTPADAHAAIATAGSAPIVLFPGQSWEVGARRDEDNRIALECYAQAYARRDALPLRPPGASVALTELKRLFEAYRQRLFAHNSRRAIAIIRRLPWLGIFRPVAIRLTDLNTTITVSIVDGFGVSPARREADAAMHSNSLAFIFSHEFGYDTLMVNGRFEASRDGLSRMSKSLGLGVLDAMGCRVSTRLLGNFRLLRLMLAKLASLRPVPAWFPAPQR